MKHAHVEEVDRKFLTVQCPTCGTNEGSWPADNDTWEPHFAALAHDEANHSQKRVSE